MTPRSPTCSRSIAPLAAVALLACSAAFAQSGPIAHWTFDEGAGTTAADSSGNGHTGTLGGGAEWTTGLIGNALRFAGADEHVAIGMAQLPAPWTFSLFVKREPGSTATSAALLGNSSYEVRLEQYDYTKKVGITGWPSEPDLNYAFNYEAPLNQWVHLAFVCSGTDTSLYVNGLLTGSTTSVIPLPLNTIGRPVNASAMGVLDDLRVYNRALSGSEIFTLASPDPAPPVARDDVYGIVGASQTIGAPGVLANDQDPNLDPFTAVKQSDPAHGTLALYADGSFVYTPTPGYEGADSFTYLARDVDGDSNVASVTLHVGGEPLPAGPVKRLLHLGSTAGKVIVGYPTSGQSILWDFMLFAGYGPEYALQPRPGQSMGMVVATNENPMVWTILDDADGDWVNGVADRYVGYWALYFHVPSARDVRLSGSVDDEAWIWIDGNPAALECAGVFNHTVALDAGWHALLLKHYENTGNDRFSLAFTHLDGSDMTDLRYHMHDVVAPKVTEVWPTHAAANVPPWQDLMVTFREPMNTSLSAEAVASLSGGSFAGSWAWTDNRTLTFTPSALWDPATTYTITLDPDLASDVSGNLLTGQTTFTFTTQARSTPGLASVSPASGWNASAPVGVTLNGVGFLEGAVTHTPGARPFGGHYYRSVMPGTDWQSARSACVASGGHLATLADAVEDQFVWKLGGRMNGWIGIYDPTFTENNQWVTGEPLAYTNWAAGEPANFGEQEPYGVYWWGFHWNDVGSSAASVRPYVCEFDRRVQPQVRLKKAGQPDRVASTVKVVSGVALTFDVDLAGAEPGLWDVELINPDGSLALLAGGFTVTESPTTSDGLLAHWTFDEGTGGTAADSSGNGHTGTLGGGAEWTPGVKGGGLRFAGVDEHVAIDMPQQAYPWTFTLFVKREQGGTASSAALLSNTNYQVQLEQYNNTKKVGITDWPAEPDRNHAFNYSAPFDRWIHLAYVCTGTQTTVYVNGQLVDSTTNVIPLPLTTIGHRADVSPKAILDDLRVFGRALSAGEIAALIGPLPPQAMDDKYSIAEDAPFSAAAPGVLANDYDLNGEVLSAALLAPPSHAQTFALSADGSFSYTPVAGYFGLDSFTYKANDGAEDSATATVTINVGGVVAHWKFDEGAGGTAADSSGNGHTGTLGGGAEWTPGVKGGGLRFAGVDEHVAIDMPHLPHPWTFSLFVKREPGGTASSAALLSSSSYQVQLEQYNHTKKVGITDWPAEPDRNHAFNYTAPFNKWIHLTYVCTGTNTLVYVNGQLVDSTTNLIPLPLTTIGHRADVSPKAVLDDLRVFDRALSPGEVAALIGPLPPQAEPDAYSIPEDAPFSVAAPGVLANDYDLNAEPLSAVLVTSPGHAQAFALNADGSFSYTPVAGYHGFDTFTYRANDGGLDSTPATVTINVSGLLAHWKFDEGTGTTAADSSGNGHTGTLQGGPTWDDGVLDGALRFNGSAKYVQVAPDGLRPAQALTASVWARMEQTHAGENCDFMRMAGNGLVGWLLRWSHQDGRVQLRIDRNSAADVFVVDTQPNSAYLNKWTHFAATYDGVAGVGILYVNGVERKRVTGVPGALEHSDNLYLGGQPYGGHASASGKLDDLRYFDRALSASEVAALIGPLPPQAEDDRYSIAEDAPYLANLPGVLANDYDLNGEALSAALITPPTHAQAFALNADGSFSYTPTAGYRGLDTFTYKANDGAEDSAAATVTINVGGLVAHWKFDDGTGTTALDSSGFNHHGTLTNGPVWTAGVVSGALDFDGSNDHIVAGDILNDLKLPCTFALWFKKDVGSGNSSLLETDGDASTYAGFWIHVAQNRTIEISYGQNSGSGPGARRTKLSPSGAFTEGNWHHLGVVVRGPTDMSLYVNGLDVGGSYSGSGGPLGHNSTPFHVGRKGTQYFPGQLDDVRIYDRALSAADVTELAAMGPPVAQPDSYLVTPDTPFSVPASGVLANDHDAGDATLTAVKDSDPAHGTLTLNADGSFLYTPAPGYTGSDSFTYHAVADSQASEPVTVSFAVGNDVTAGLIGHWKLDEGTGTTAADSSANANHGTLVNGTMWGEGYKDGCLVFDMVNDNVKVPRHTSLEPTTGITVASWANMAFSRSGSYCDLVRKAATIGYLLRWSHGDGRVQWRIDRDAAPDLAAVDLHLNTAYLNQWHHFVGTYDSATGVAILYVDGKEHARATGTPGVLEHSDDLYFSDVRSPGVSAEGSIDDVRVYDRALTGAEVLALSQSAPVAVADGYGVAQSGTLNVSAEEGVLANDRDPNGQGIFALLEGAAPAGLSFQSDGSFTYTPPGGTTGLVTFAYRASDGNLTSTPVSVSIRLDAPLLNVTGLSSAVGFVEAELSREVHAGSVSASSVTVTRAGPDQLFGTADDTLIDGTLQLVGGNKIRFVPDGGVFFDDRYRLCLKSTGPYASAVAQTSAGRDGVVLSSVSPTLAAGPGPLSLTLLGQNIPIFNGSTTALPTVTFDGVDDQFGIPDADTLDVPAITLEAWVQPNTGGWVLSKRSNAPFQWNKFQLTSSSGARFHTVPDAGTPMFDLEHGSDFAYPFGTWQHLAATFQPNPDGNSGIKRLFINGVLQGEEAFPYKLADSSYQMNLGRFQGDNWAGYYKGKMAEVRYWKVARTQAQIRASMFGAVMDPDLIFRYDFNESGPTATDRTGNGHTASSGGGVLFGGAVHVAPLMARLVKGSDEAVCSGAISSDGSTFTCEVDTTVLPSGIYDLEVLEGRSLLLARLARGVLVLSGDGVAASDGGVLDGEYDAALPSGNAEAGGDFVTEFTIDGQTPIVVSTVPANGATGVNQAADIEIEFSEAMNRASVEAAIEVDPAAPYAAEWNGHTLVLRTSTPLAELTEYTVTIGVGAQDLGGTALATPYVFSFTTGQITVTAINPSSSYPGLALSDVRIEGTTFFEGSAEPGPPEAVPFGGHAYLYVAMAATWTTAKANCEALGGHLVTINSAEENAFVASLFSTGKAWIGATDAVLEGAFVWNNGEPVTYTNWYAGEPNNSGNEDYVEMLAGGLWNDRNNLSQGYICEFERAPPTVKLKLGATEIPASRIRFVSESELRVDFSLAGAASGAYDVVVTNPDGGGTGTLPGGFQVLELPQLLTVTPPVADQNATVALTLTGSNLPTWTGTAQGPPSYSTYGVRVTNGSNTVYATGALNVSATTLTCNLNLTGLPLGLYDVTLLSGATALATLPQGLRIIDPALTVTDLAGNALDGEFPGTLGDVQPDGLPSVNGTAGGDFVAYFDLQTSRMQVTALQPAPGAVLPAGPLEILATFAKPLHSESVTTGSFELIRRGPDGTWNSSDDVRIVPAGIQFPAGHQAKLDLTGVPLINDTYRVRLKSSLPSGGMLYLDGSNDHVSIPDSASLQCTEAVTVEAWFRFESGGSQNPRVVSEKSVFPEITTVGTGSSRRIDTNINLQGVGIVRVNGVTLLDAGQWHHAAVTYDRTALKMYLNGVLEGQTAATAPIVVTGNPHVLGRQQGTSNDHFKGHLDEVRFWNRSRTLAEIQADMRRTLNGNELGLVGYWTFDEGTGQALLDRSAHGNHGTLGATSSAASDDPTRGAATTPLDGGVRDSHGNALDGEYPGAGGALPSGDGTAGGDFVAEFVVLSPYPALAAVNLTPGATLSTGPVEILATFTKDLDPATVTAAHAHVLSAGPDGAFGSGDDIQFVPGEVALENGNRIRLDLSNITWSSNFYRLRFMAGGLTDTSGNILDGEYPGLGGAGNPLPTGNGSGGGNSLLGFRINLPPTPAADGFEVDEDSTLYAASVLNNDSDLHGGDPGENNLPLSAELIAGPVHAQAFTFNADGTFTYTPVADYYGSDGFTYSAKDSLGMASAPTAVTLTVNSINDPPIALTDSYELDEDTLLNGSSVLTNDSDLHGGALGENNISLSASLVVGPGHALAFTLNSDGTFQYTPQTDFFGFDSFTYKAVDMLGGASATTTVTLTVLPVEDIPTLTISAGLSSAVEADPGDLLDFIADAADADPDEVFVFHWDFGDGNTSSEQNPDHDYAEPGLYEVVATVTDSDGNQTQASMFVAVSGILKYTNLKVDQASYTLNHGKKAASGPMVDSWTLKGKINVQDLVAAGMNPANLTGQPLTARIADAETALGTPTRISSSSVQWQSPRGATPTFKATFSPVTGIFTLTLSQVDLATGLAAYGADNTGGSSGKLVLTPVELNLGPWTGTAVLGTRYTQTRVNASGKGAFKLGLSAHPLPSGLFFVDKLQVTQANQGGVLKQRLSISATFLAMPPANFDPRANNAGAVVELGEFSETVGDGTLPGVFFTLSNGDTFTYAGPRNVLPGDPVEAGVISSFKLSRTKGTLTLMSNWTPVGPGDGIFGLPPVLDARNDPRTHATFVVAIDMEGVGGRQTVRLMRSGTSWKR